MKRNPFHNLIGSLQSPRRNTSIDFCRGIAILAVVLYHFDGYLPFGSLGVDLFFVISGLLVGGLLTSPYLQEEPIDYTRFILRRGFKIWPSYYTFLFVGTGIALLFYDSQHASQIIPFSDMKRYVLFYQNYTGTPLHWSFDHLWSLCVEEHFYLLLPLLFALLSIRKSNPKLLYLSLVTIIILGFVFKVIALYYTHSQDTYSATHNRIDALAWGVLLNLILKQNGSKIKEWRYNYLATLLGIIGLAILLMMTKHGTIFYNKVVFHSLVPICFTMMIFGTYYYDFSKVKLIRIFGYYSYNWYLWHPVIVIITQQYFGVSTLSLSVYLLISLSVAMFFTIIVEEPILALRKQVSITQ